MLKKAVCVFCKKEMMTDAWEYADEPVEIICDDCDTRKVITVKCPVCGKTHQTLWFEGTETEICDECEKNLIA
ncbi:MULTISPECIES: hypothetical protein [Anaerolinea]|uniref:hypothetical protein n=1 Tax=Anaerolinea TaxID=233189 RepID=UPI0026171832|nr:hypothetical protein [Anaerolinea thermophila]